MGGGGGARTGLSWSLLGAVAPVDQERRGGHELTPRDPTVPLCAAAAPEDLEEGEGVSWPLLVFAGRGCPSGPRGARVTLASLGALWAGRGTGYGRRLLFLREREGPILR